LFGLSGLGNGSAYKMIPSVFAQRARVAISQGTPREVASVTAARLTGAVIGVAGAVGTLGGLFINLALRASFQATHTADGAVWGFLAYYGACVLLTWLGFARLTPPRPRREVISAVPAAVPT
jgi:NNP family nitrate/nitrite transporter-like MFS transporter